jgi:hemoglobin-like flavoprotein
MSSENANAGDDIQQVVASYHRSRASGALFDAFYAIFLEKSPEIRAKFANTDFDRQKRMLKESLLTMLNLCQGSTAAAEEIDRLGELHGREHHDIRPELYRLWLDALCEAIAAHDPEYRPELEARWRRAMQCGIDRMLARY